MKLLKSISMGYTTNLRLNLENFCVAVKVCDIC